MLPDPNGFVKIERSKGKSDRGRTYLEVSINPDCPIWVASME